MIYKTLSARIRAERRHEELKATFKALACLTLIVLAVVAMNYALKVLALSMVVLKAITN